MLQHLRADSGGREILPDWALPDALCVPLWAFDIRATLEALGTAAADHVGVILITRDPGLAESFVAAQEVPDHFGIVIGGYDSPWLRDHAPIAVREGDGIVQVRPAMPETGRPNDTDLFATIMPQAREVTPLRLAGGNLIVGLGGLAVSTDNVLAENGCETVDDLAPMARQLGIRDWVIVPRFADDISGHSDLMLRFLGPDLCALCARKDDAVAAEITADLRETLIALRPGLRFVSLPAVAVGESFDSPLNWVQLGDHLLVPDFGVDDPFAEDRAERLRQHGLHTVSIPTETGRLGGALHCLTASVFAG